jgi:hypothetical protein
MANCMQCNSASVTGNFHHRLAFLNRLKGKDLTYMGAVVISREVISYCANSVGGQVKQRRKLDACSVI